MSILPTDPIADGSDERRRRRRGLALALLGVAVFAATAPMTRLAVGDDARPQLSPLFVAAGRAALAALLAAAWLVAVRSPWPRADQWRSLAVTAGGAVVGFPLLLGFALRHVDASRAAVVIGVLPLATAACAAVVQRQRATPAFWASAVVGAAIVVGYALRGGAGLGAADALLLLAVASAAVGYVWGARLSLAMPPAHVISWALVVAAPLTLPVAWLDRPSQPVDAAAWGGFVYVAVFSMWLGFFAWYRGLAQAGTLRASQVQLLQPFLSLAFAVPLLGERIDAATVGCAAAVVVALLAGQRAAAR
jgi:drug/metabolite transporter (DMT)-like permease